MFTRPLSPASGLSPAASRNAAFIPSISACKSRPATRAYYGSNSPFRWSLTKWKPKDDRLVFGRIHDDRVLADGRAGPAAMSA